MTKAAPWNINGVGLDARESAREAALRQGKSIGEWLHGVIADHATELGVAERDVADRDRPGIIADKLRAMITHDRGDSRRLDVADTRAMAPASHATPEHHLGADGDKQRQDRVDGDTHNAPDGISTTLKSFAKMLESGEDKRGRERQSIKELAQKLSTIETELIERNKTDENPIKGSLARLEARLDAIGRRSAAEAEARRKAPASQEMAIESEPMRELEDELNSILGVVSNRAAAPSGAPASPPSAPLMKDGAPDSETPAARSALKGTSPRRFDNAVAEIAKRQASLDEASSGKLAPPACAAELAKPPLTSDPPTRHPVPMTFETMQGEMTGLAKAVEEVRRELARGHDLPDRYASDIEGLRADIGAMARSLDGLAPRESMTALEDAIKAVAIRLETSRDSGIREAVLRPIEEMVGDLRRAMGELDQRRAIGGLETGIAALGDKIEHLERGGIGAAALASIQEQVDEIRNLVAATATRHVGFEKIEARVAALVERVERQPSSRLDTAALEGLVRDLGQKIEAVRAPSADHQAIEALQVQIGLLASRFDETANGLPALSTLERSMRELFAQLEETRTSVETSAARAAREVLRIAAAETRDAPGPERDQERDIAALKTMQDEADARTSSTLNAVHETLEKVVDRLSSMEGDLEDVRSRHKRPVIETNPPRSAMTSEPDDRRAALSASLGMISPDQTSVGLAATTETSLDHILHDEVRIGGVDPIIDAAFDRKPAPRSGNARPFGVRGNPADLDDEAGRADFIAAARRAAQVAQTDPSVIAIKRPVIATGNQTRAGLLARSRDYVASHKKPVLLGFAALFVMIGTVAIVQRTGLLMGLIPKGAIADRGAPPKVAVMATAPAARVQTAAAASTAPALGGSEAPKSGSARNDGLSPSAMPKAAPLAKQFAGSDPTQTGSIPSLPAFAAHAASAPPRGLPSGLKAKVESGDGAAEYELGSRYGEGRGVPRDMKIAAKWYEKAAAQGIVPAQYRLASLYEKGLGVAQSKERAKSLYQQAAEAGSPRAMHNLAVMLADAEGKPDFDAAALWFRKAAQYGIHDSQFNFAILLARGLGVSQSLVQSYQWFEIAAAQNDPDAAKKRDEVGLKLSANDIGVAKALAAAFHPRIANPSTLEVRAPADGWDGAASPSHLNSARAKISSL